MLEDIYNKYNVDISRLKRDYIKNPLKILTDKYPHYWEMPDKEDCYYLFIELNMHSKDLMKLFGISKIKLSRIMRKYGIYKNPLLVQQNVIKCMKEKYGVENFSQTENKQIISIEKRKEKYGETISKIIEDKNLLKQYIIDNNIKSCKDLAKSFNMEYEVIRKIVANNHFQEYFSKIFTKEEDEVFDILKDYFSDIIRQYKTNLYPYPCDFYIPSKDLYIEYQRYWTHYIEPFNELNEKHIQILNKWKSKNTKQYNKAIRTWTIIDPLKRKIAKDNNLNWIEFFNKEQIIDWLKSQ